MARTGEAGKGKRKHGGSGSDAEDLTGEVIEQPLDLTVITGMSGAGKSEAVATYEAMLKRDPEDIAAANNLALLLVTHRSDAASLARAGELTARFKDSTSPGLLDTYGWVAFKRGEATEAAAALERATTLAPDAPELRYHLGMAQLELGRRDEARKNLEAAVQAGRDFPGLAEAREALGSF